MKIRIAVLAVLSMLPFFASAQLFQESLVPSSKQSVVYVGAYDWGPCIEKIVINAGYPVLPEKVRSDDFTVEQILYPKGTTVGMPKNELTITDTFVSDALGNRSDEPNDFITILTDVHPEAENSSPFVTIILESRFYNYYGYKISNKELGLSITNLKGFVNKDVARFKTGKFSYVFPATAEEKAKPRYEEKTLTIPYASYVPKVKKKKKIPLILWFHGMGEGGQNPYQVLLGTKSSALATDKIQKYFADGAAVLLPQCPTGWLETTEESSIGVRYWEIIDKDSVIDKIKNPISNFLNKILVIDDTPKEEKTPFAAVSYYTEPVKKLLFTFLAEYPEIDRERIYVGGCSAGGYMTMNMMIQNPELFAAAFPICEYYLDSKITESQIKMLAEKPFWFTYAKNDGIVNPEKNSIPTINRLRLEGAGNVHVSEFENVVDTSGKYLLKRDADADDDEFGLPYEYNGHYSWIYALNDECRESGVSLFEWLSRQKL